MKALMFASLLLLWPLAARAEWKRPVNRQIAVQALAVTALWVDALQSLDLPNHMHQHETNVLLGMHPPAWKTVLAVGVLPSLLLTALWFVLPDGWREALSAGVLGFELVVVIRNQDYGLRF